MFHLPVKVLLELRDLGWALLSVLLTFNKKFDTFFERFFPRPGIKPGMTRWQKSVLLSTQCTENMKQGTLEKILDFNSDASKSFFRFHQNFKQKKKKTFLLIYAHLL